MKKKNLLMTAIAIFGLATITFGQTVPSNVPTTGLVGWWPFTGNANDESGNGNNGIVNGATLTNDRNGVANSAYSFDGDDRIDVGNLNLGQIQYSYTYSTWFKTSSTSNTDKTIISDYNSSSGDDDIFSCWHLLEFNNHVHCDARNLPNGYGVSNNTALNNGVWHNMVSVLDRNSGQLELYVDSIFISSTSFPNQTNFDANGFLRFGVHMWSNTFQSSAYWIGEIDDIGIWNRALTPQEITDLYNGCQLSVNSQPTNQTININTNTQFVVSSSDPIAIYQWQTDLGVGFQNLNSVGQYSGATNDTLNVSNVTLSNNNQPFRCIVSSGSCSDTSNVAVLTVNNNVGINETSQDNLFSVFPNPAQSVINVKSDSKFIGSAYTIYDNTGKVVLTGKLNSQNTTIELGNLSGGIYMFSVGENMKQTFKVIKE